MGIKHWFKDSNGNIAGATDDDGYTYDRDGNWTGRVSGSEMYDNTGSYMGKADSSGRIYDSNGNYAGRVHDDGWVEDRDGHFTHRL